MAAVTGREKGKAVSARLGEILLKTSTMRSLQHSCEWWVVGDGAPPGVSLCLVWVFDDTSMRNSLSIDGPVSGDSVLWLSEWKFGTG